MSETEASERRRASVLVVRPVLWRDDVAAVGPTDLAIAFWWC